MTSQSQNRTPNPKQPTSPPQERPPQSQSQQEHDAHTNSARAGEGTEQPPDRDRRSGGK
jgi:hypothetical protein